MAFQESKLESLKVAPLKIFNSRLAVMRVEYVVMVGTVSVSFKDHNAEKEFPEFM